jgi:hypothetical protein
MAEAMPWLGDWNFCRKIDCQDEAGAWRPKDNLAAQDFLQQYRTDADKMFAMRAMVWEEGFSFSLPWMSDDEIIEQAAALISFSRVHIHTYVAAPVAIGTTGATPAGGGPAFPIGARKAAPPPSDVAPSDPPTFSNIDAGVQAAALMAAAAAGLPFCSECGKNS